MAHNQPQEVSEALQVNEARPLLQLHKGRRTTEVLWLGSIQSLFGLLLFFTFLITFSWRLIRLAIHGLWRLGRPA